MRRAGRAVLVVTAALAAGAAAAAEPTLEESWTLVFSEDVRSVTHGGAVGIARFPADILPFSEGAQRNLALTTELRDATGRVVGIAAELEEFPAQSKTPEAPWKTWWALVVNGRGSLFLEHLEAVPKELAPVLAEFAAGRDWKGRASACTSVGPRPDGLGRIVGGTGEFAGVQGTFVECSTLTGMTAAGVLSGQIELRVSFFESPAARQSPEGTPPEGATPN